MLLKSLLAFIVATSAAMAASPWDDPTIAIDPEAERQVREQLLENRAAILRVQQRLIDNGAAGGNFLSLTDAKRAYCEAASSLAWAKKDFEASYRYARLASLTSEKSVEATKAYYETGQVSLVDYLAAQDRSSRDRLVLLRYETLAKKYSLDIQRDADLDLDAILKSELQRDEDKELEKSNGNAEALPDEEESELSLCLE